MTPHVLLVGANDRATPSTARALRRAGYLVDVADWTRHAIRRSRFVDGFFLLRSPLYDVDACAADLLALVRRRGYRYVVPMHDEALEICAAHRDELLRCCALPGVNPPAVHRYAHDKHALHVLAQELGLAVPRFVLLRGQGDLQQHRAALRYPLIVKPIHSRVIHDNRLYTFTVRRAADEPALRSILAEHEGVVPVMAQEVLVGPGLGYNVLCRDGEVLRAYAHQRLHEAWGGGQSSYRRTLLPEAFGLAESSARLLRRTGWTGVAMLEYKLHDGAPYIMEMNGRFWGSLELGLFAGADLPTALLSLAAGEPLSARPPERRVVYARNLKNDLIWALQGAVKGRDPGALLRCAVSLPHALSPDEVIEDSLLRDPAFRLSLLAEDIERAGRKLGARLMREWVDRRRRSEHRSRQKRTQGVSGHDRDRDRQQQGDHIAT